MVAQSVGRSEWAGARDLGSADEQPGNRMARGGSAECGTRARWQRDPVRQEWPDLSREGVGGEACHGAGSWGEAVHHRVGRPKRSKVVAGRTQDRVRDYADGP